MICSITENHQKGFIYKAFRAYFETFRIAFGETLRQGPAGFSSFCPAHLSKGQRAKGKKTAARTGPTGRQLQGYHTETRPCAAFQGRLADGLLAVFGYLYLLFALVMKVRDLLLSALLILFLIVLSCKKKEETPPASSTTSTTGASSTTGATTGTTTGTTTGGTTGSTTGTVATIDVSKFVGTKNVEESCSGQADSYVCNVSKDNSTNGKIWFDNFWNIKNFYGITQKVFGNVSGSSVNIPSQTVSGNNYQIIISGTGTYNGAYTNYVYTSKVVTGYSFSCNAKYK